MKTLIITLSIALGAFILIPNIVTWNNRPSPYTEANEDLTRFMNEDLGIRTVEQEREAAKYR